MSNKTYRFTGWKEVERLRDKIRSWSKFEVSENHYRASVNILATR